MMFLFEVLGNSTAQKVVSSSISSDFRTAIVGIVLLVLAVLVILKLKDFVINSFLGLIALFLLNLIGVAVPINLVSIAISGILGLAGVGILVVLFFFGFVIH